MIHQNIGGLAFYQDAGSSPAAYWTLPNNVVTSPYLGPGLSGGTASIVASVTSQNLGAIAADSTGFYFLSTPSMVLESTNLYACPLEGCGSGPTLLALLHGLVGGMAVGHGRVYMLTNRVESDGGADWVVEWIAE